MGYFHFQSLPEAVFPLLSTGNRIELMAARTPEGEGSVRRWRELIDIPGSLGLYVGGDPLVQAGS